MGATPQRRYTYDDLARMPEDNVRRRSPETYRPGDKLTSPLLTASRSPSTRSSASRADRPCSKRDGGHTPSRPVRRVGYHDGPECGQQLVLWPLELPA